MIADFWGYFQLDLCCVGGGALYSVYSHVHYANTLKSFEGVIVRCYYNDSPMFSAVPIIPNLLKEMKHHSRYNGPSQNVTLNDYSDTDSNTTATSTNMECNKTTDALRNMTQPPCVDHNHDESKAEVKSKRKAYLRDTQKETVLVGLIMSSKAFVQLLTNPFVGPLTHRSVTSR